MHSLENIISLHQAAEISGYTQDYLGYLIRNGEIKGVKKGGIWFTTEKEVKDYILNQKNNSQKSAQQNKKDFLQKVTQKKLAVKELLSRPQTHNILIFTFLLFMGISSFAFAFNKTSNLPRENFSNTTKQISSSLHNGIVHPVLSFASTVSEVTKSVPDQLQSTSTSLAYGWSAFTNGLLNNIKDSVNGIKQFAVSVGNGVKFDSLSNFSNEIASSFIYSVSLFPRITNSIGSSLQGTSENLAYGWSSFANGILKNSIDGINADKQFAISLPSKIKSTYIASKDLGLNNTASVGNRITSVGDSLQSTSTSLAYGWSAFTNGLLNNITNFVNGTKLIGNSIADGWSSTKNFVASLFDKKENPLAVVPITETLPALNPSPADSVPLASSPTPTITTTIIQQISKAGLTGHTGKTGPQGPRGQKGDKGDTTDMSNYVTLTAYDRQVAGLLSSIENNVKNLSDSLSAEVDTALLKVNGNASVTGDTTLIGLLNVTGDTTLNSNAVISGTLTVLGDITGNLIGNITGSTINGLSITNNGTNTLNIAAGRSLIVNNSLTLAGTDSTTMTFPTTSATIARTDAAQTFTGAQTFSSTIEGNLHGNVTGNVTGNLTGNADTATTLKNPRTIAGVSFDGSQNINIPSTNLSDTTNIARLDATNAFSNTGNTSFAGNVGVGITNPSAYLNIKAGTASANTAPLKFTSGSLLTNPEVGALEFNNDAYYGTVTTLAIGDSYGGGVIVYILQAGDPGYVAGYQKGLIAATSDQSSGADWGCNLITIAGADGTAIGTGEQNTISIMNGCASTGIAARISGDLVLNGYSDWYLPSKDELNQVYINRAYLGVFSSNPYWTSSQSGSQSAWSQSFVTGQQDNWFGGKTDSQHSVRSIRSFSVVTRGKFAFTSDVANLYVPYTGGTTNVDLGLHNLTVDNNSLFVDSVNHKVGIGTTVPTNLLSLSGTSSRTIWMERNTTVATGGQGLTLSSGGAIAGTNNLAGGDLSLKSGISTGTGTSALHFFTTTAGSSGATDNTPTEKMTILGNGNVGIGTTNPRAALEVAGNADGAILATGTYGSGWTELNLGAGTRMLWYPQKAAFRVGYVDGTQWNNANIGIYSTAMGYNTTASGVNSIAMGYGTKASINYATAMGGNTTASGWYSTAMGDSTTASGYASMALEGSTTASGWYSTSMGNYTTASGTYSTSMGYNTTASGTYSVAMGQFTKANSFNSVAIGRNNVGGGTSDSWVATDPLFEIGNGTGTGVNAANALTVLKNGNVGIGTTSPVYTLQVNNALTTQAMLVNNTGVGSSALDFSISNVASPTALARIIATRTNRGANGDTDLTFLNYTNSALTEKMRIMDNGNVGIGTTSPGQLLEVKGNDPYITANANTGTNPGFKLLNNGTEVWRIDDTTASSDRMRIMSQAGGLEVMSLLQTGNVGIGTTSPKSLLEVAGSTTKTGIYIYNNSGGGGGIPRLGFKASNGYDSTSVLAAVDAVPVASANTATNLVFSTSGNNSAASAGLTERMRIDSTGNVGIGTTNTPYMLNIYNSQNGGTGFEVKNDNTGTNAFVDYQLSNGTKKLYAYQFGESYSSAATRFAASSGVIEEDGTGGLGLSASAGVIKFYTGGNNERMRVDNTGNVGIGTTGPRDILDVRAAGTDRILLANNSISDVNQDSPKLSFWGGGNNTTTTILGPSIQKISTGAWGAGRLAFFQHDIGNYTNETEAMSIASNGNVGIGDPSPGQKLSIAGTNTQSNFSVNNASGVLQLLDTTTPSAVGVGPKIVFGSTYYTGGSTMAAASIGSYKEYAPDNGTNEYSHSLVFSTNNSSTGVAERMRITSLGNVGIGTKVPQSALSFASPTPTSNNLLSTIGVATTAGNDTGALFISGGGSWPATRGGAIYLSGENQTTYGGNVSIMAGDANAVGGNIGFATGGSDRMTILKNGNVGIGTTAPGRKLDITDTGSGDIIVQARGSTSGTSAGWIAYSQNDNNNSSYLYVRSTSASGSIINSAANGTGTLQPINFQIGGSTKTIMDTSGNIGIGIAPSYKLDVAGDIRSTGGSNYGTLILGDSNHGIRSNSGLGVTIFTYGASNGIFLQQVTGNVVIGSLGTGPVYSNGGTLTNTNPSDRNLKNTINPLGYGLAEIMQLQPKSFYYNDDINHKRLQYGFIAQEVQLIMPDVVRPIGDGSGMLGLETNGIYVAGIKAIQELNLKLEDASSLDTTKATSLGSLITKFLADAKNGIGDFYANRVRTKQICVAKADGTEFCANGDELQAMAKNSMSSIGGNTGGTGGSTGDATCVAPSTMIAGVCTAPAGDTTCVSPSTIIDGVCTAPADGSSTTTSDISALTTLKTTAEGLIGTNATESETPGDHIVGSLATLTTANAVATGTTAETQAVIDAEVSALNDAITAYNTAIVPTVPTP